LSIAIGETVAIRAIDEILRTKKNLTSMYVCGSSGLDGNATPRVP